MEGKRIERLYQTVKANRKNCRFGDIEGLLNALGFIARQGGGSHVTFRRAGTPPLTVPKARPVKAIYVDRVLEIADRILKEPSS